MRNTNLTSVLVVTRELETDIYGTREQEDVYDLQRRVFWTGRSFTSLRTFRTGRAGGVGGGGEPDLKAR